ncbi:MAG: tetratricopeptide repeat protein [Cyanobacteria bacterium P01_F01_bin.143]
MLNHPNSNAIVLYGQRRIGKTSVLLQLEKKLLGEGKYTPVYFDLQDKAEKLLPELLYEIAGSISSAIGQSMPDSSLFDDSGNFFKSQFLPEVSKNTSEGGLILLFDEFDVLDSPQQAKAGQSFFPYLRSWMTEIESVQFVFVIGRRPEDLSIKTLSTFKGVRAKRISHINRASAEALIRQAEKENSLRWSDAAIEHLWEICQGHTYFTQLLCSVIFENAYDEEPTEIPEVNENDIDNAIDEALEQGANSFNWIWDGLPPAERIIVSAMAEKTEKIITQEKLIKILNRSGVRLIVRELELAPEMLVEWELLRKVDGGYSFVVPLLKYWVAKNRPLPRVKEELDRLDPLAETLFRAGQIYYSSHQFTEAENNLRQSLKINPNHLKSRLLLGRMLLELDRAEESVDILEEAYKYDERSAQADLIKSWLAVAENSNKDESNLISIYQRILTIDKFQPLAQERLEKISREKLLRELEAKAELAKQKETEGDWKAAIQILEEILSKKPANQDWQARLQNARFQEIKSLKKLAQDYESEEKWSAAIAIYESLLEQYPEQQKWVICLQQVRDKEQLLIAYNQAIGALENEDNETAIKLLSEVIYKQPNFKNAPEYLLYITKDIDIEKLQNELIKERQRREKAEVLLVQYQTKETDYTKETIDIEKLQCELAKERQRREKAEVLLVQYQTKETDSAKNSIDIEKLQSELAKERYRRRNAEKSLFLLQSTKKANKTPQKSIRQENREKNHQKRKG